MGEPTLSKSLHLRWPFEGGVLRPGCSGASKSGGNGIEEEVDAPTVVEVCDDEVVTSVLAAITCASKSSVFFTSGTFSDDAF